MGVTVGGWTPPGVVGLVVTMVTGLSVQPPSVHIRNEDNVDTMMSDMK